MGRIEGGVSVVLTTVQPSARRTLPVPADRPAGIKKLPSLAFPFIENVNLFNPLLLSLPQLLSVSPTVPLAAAVDFQTISVAPPVGAAVRGRPDFVRRVRVAGLGAVIDHVVALLVPGAVVPPNSVSQVQIEPFAPRRAVEPPLPLHWLCFPEGWRSFGQTALL